MSHKPPMHGGGESYSGVVPTKQPNKSEPSPAEVAEGRPLTKENTPESNPSRTPSRVSGQAGQSVCARQLDKGGKLQPHPDSGVGANIRGKNHVR
jgi:hypothetical protein